MAESIFKYKPGCERISPEKWVKEQIKQANKLARERMRKQQDRPNNVKGCILYDIKGNEIKSFISHKECADYFGVNRSTPQRWSRLGAKGESFDGIHILKRVKK